MRPFEQPIKRLIVHHSASPLSTMVEDVRSWHVEGNGWDDIGYHWLVPSDGQLVIGRPLHLEGAHTRGYNRQSLGVCLIGDNTDPVERWRPAQVETLMRLWLACRTVYGAELALEGHRDITGPSTICPGVDVRAMLLGPMFSRGAA